MMKSLLRIAASTLLLLAQSDSAMSGDIFAEASAGRNKVITSAYFGTHFHRLVLNQNEKAIQTVWPSLAFGSVRLWDSGTLWAEVTPRAGQWTFDRMDAYVGGAKSHGASVLYTLGGTPRWASARPDERCPYGFGCSAESVRIAHWEEYVRRVAQRYRGLIGAFELWNEPNFSDIARDRAQPVAFFSSIANMVEMARTARKVLDETSPGTILTTPGFVNGPDRLEMFLEAGGKAYIQAVTYHFYSNDAEDFMRRVLEVREVMRRQGVEALPLWNTEQGVEVYPENVPLPHGVRERLTRSGGAARMAQYLVLGAAAGLERFYYYAWDNEHSGMVTRRGEGLPAYEAMAKVQDWLIGTRLRGCASPSRGTVSCQIQSGKQTFLVAWASQPGEQTLKLPRGSKVIGIETLFASTPPPNPQVKQNQIEVSLGAEPVRIALDQQPQP
jgi:hypothetical protein